ncbi:hypothetical protein ACFVIM_20790 [Streptomyces sp. NPDC057638]|uniref:hypothetical protein n=1 Tax=Streptomyces sp. NPDC057638 TaxID=3346190 RepID=UPI0036CCE782
MPGRLSEESRRRRDRVLRTLDRVIARYQNGAPLVRLSQDYGVTTDWLRERLLDSGVEIRGLSAARRLRVEQDRRQRDQQPTRPCRLEAPLSDCPTCHDLITAEREALAVQDHSHAVDCRVLLRRHQDSDPHIPPPSPPH